MSTSAVAPVGSGNSLQSKMEAKFPEKVNKLLELLPQDHRYKSIIEKLTKEPITDTHLPFYFQVQKRYCQLNKAKNWLDLTSHGLVELATGIEAIRENYITPNSGYIKKTQISKLLPYSLYFDKQATTILLKNTCSEFEKKEALLKKSWCVSGQVANHLINYLFVTIKSDHPIHNMTTKKRFELLSLLAT